jgi:UDP-N-acetylmuramyl pentapeptide phosphotransferase/UDP-N-acetylglucosamine-1-phosphate transferase
MPGRALRLVEPPIPRSAPGVSWRERLRRYAGGRGLLLLPVLLGVLLLLGGPVKEAVRQGAGTWVHLLLLSGGLALLLTPASEILAVALGAVAGPDRRRDSTRPTPRLGGVAVLASIGVALLAAGAGDPRLLALPGAAILLLAVGVLHEIFPLSPSARVLSQLLASLLLVQSGVLFEILPQTSAGTRAANAVLTLLWLFAIPRAFARFDSMDGLAGGLALVVASILGVNAFLDGEARLLLVGMATAGACTGFLPYNFPWRGPASVSLGRGGALALGLLLAGLAVLGSDSGEGVPGRLAVPLLIFGVPIFDGVRSLFSRAARLAPRGFRAGDPRGGDRPVERLPQRFESLLRSKRQAVLLLLLLTLVLGLSALVLRGLSSQGVLLLLVQCGAVLVVITVLELVGNRRERRTRLPPR